jgi:hypothetical protein
MLVSRPFKTLISNQNLITELSKFSVRSSEVQLLGAVEEDPTVRYVCTSSFFFRTDR